MKDKIRNRDGRGRFTATKPEIKEKIMEVEMKELRTPQQWEKIVKAAKNGFCGLAGKLAEDYGFETKHILAAFENNRNGLSRLDLVQIAERKAVYIYKKKEKKTKSKIETSKNQKIEKAEYTIPLNVAGKNLSAKIIIKRDGQEDAKKGNRVRVRCSLYLPSSKNKGLVSTVLNKKIEFGVRARVEVFGMYLYSVWGDQSPNGNFRYKNMFFTGTSFPALFEEAKKYAFSEIKKLNNLLDARRQAYLDAN